MFNGRHVWHPFACLIGLVALVGLPGAAWAQATITVDSTSGLRANDGNCTLREALTAANTNVPVDGCAAGSVAGPDTVVVPAGVYVLTEVDVAPPCCSGPVGLPTIESAIIIEGATGNPEEVVIRRDPTGPLFAILGVSATGTFTLRNVRLSGGKPGVGGEGSGIVLNGTNPLTLENCIMSDHDATLTTGGASRWGAIGRGQGGQLNVTNCLFSGNKGAEEGSAIQWVGSFNIRNSTFIDNTATRGGALKLNGNLSSSITDSLIVGNVSTSRGGAVEALGGGTLTISNSFFSNNSSPNDGGAIYSENKRLVISGSTFDGNVSNGNAGAILGTSTTLDIRNSTFSANHAANEGGAIFSSPATTLNNVSFIENVADSNGDGNGRGGAIFVQGGTLSVANTLMVGNRDRGAAPDCPFPNNGAIITSLGHNLATASESCPSTSGIGDLFGSTAAPVSPVLGILKDNGGVSAGASFVMRFPEVVPTHALLVTSEALDVGDPGTPGGAAPACEATDQRGTFRPNNGRCDIGAFEAPSNGLRPDVDVSVTVSDSVDPAGAGDVVAYEVVVTSSAVENAPEVVVFDALPEGVSFVSSVPADVCTEAAGDVTCPLGVVPAGESVSISIVTSPSAAAVTPLSNTVTVTTGGNDTDPSNDSDTETTDLTGVCGDGTLQAVSEECDDGNYTPGDGCDPSCQLEGGEPDDAGVPDDAGPPGDDAGPPGDDAGDPGPNDAGQAGPDAGDDCPEPVDDTPKDEGGGAPNGCGCSSRTGLDGLAALALLAVLSRRRKPIERRHS